MMDVAPPSPLPTSRMTRFSHDHLDIRRTPPRLPSKHRPLRRSSDEKGRCCRCIVSVVQPTQRRAVRRPRFSLSQLPGLVLTLGGRQPRGAIPCVAEQRGVAQLSHDGMGRLPRCRQTSRDHAAVSRMLSTCCCWRRHRPEGPADNTQKHDTMQCRLAAGRGAEDDEDEEEEGKPD